MTKRANSGSAMHALLDLDLGEESSSDSDFRIEDHDGDDGSDFSDDNSNRSDADDNNDGDGSDDGEDDEGGDSDSDDDFSFFKDSLNSGKQKNGDEKPIKTEGEAVQNGPTPTLSSKELLKQAKAKEALDRANAKMLATPICCACLGDRSDDTNEIVECDNCGISVHEGCYGISDSASISSTVSSCSTEPWFCEACKANVAEPICELCPNKGGIFKETDVGKWVHLVCALYVPGVAFGEVDHLSSVTLFEMQYSKWGSKSCSLCEDVRFARTGVCIGCDAGMCKTYFHVTCAQAAGLLSEAHSEEADHADPFYAHCKLHSDKSLIKHRKRNFNGLRLKMNHRISEQLLKLSSVEPPATSTNEQLRIERKLKKHRNKYVMMKTVKQEPWVPTQKMPRLLSTSASACRKLILKAELMGIDTAALEFQEAQMTALADVRKKWHIPPAFSVEFIGYYLDRIARLKEIKASLQQQMELNQKLTDDQQRLRMQYDELIKDQPQHSDRNRTLKETAKKLHDAIKALCPTKSLPDIDLIGLPPPPPPVVLPVDPPEPPPKPVSNNAAAPLSHITAPPARPMSVPTAAALKMGVGFPLTNLPGTNEDSNRILSTQCLNNSSKLMHECGICAKRTDQHLLAKCDTCHLHYHLGCLNPPLSRHPKKSKLYGWQCSECVKSDDSDATVTTVIGPRKSRTKYGKDGTIVPVDSQNTDDSMVMNATGTSSDSFMNLSAELTRPFADKPEPTVETIVPGKPDKRKKSEKISSESDPLELPSFTSMCSSDVDPLDDSTHSAAKRKKVKKSATVVGDDVASGPGAAQLSTAAPSQECPPVADKDQDQLDISKTNGSMPSVGTTDCQAAVKPPKTKPNKKPKKEKILANHNTTTNTTYDSTPTSNALPPLKPSYYIDQNGVLTCLPTAAGNFTSELVPTAARPDVVLNAVGLTETELLQLHKQQRKRRKEKHRSKHHHGEDGGANGTENEQRSPKKKRKKKSSSHDMENPETKNSATGVDGIPRIKIKFKALSLPGEPAAESHCFYVSAADMVRPADDEFDHRSTGIEKPAAHAPKATSKPSTDITSILPNGGSPLKTPSKPPKQPKSNGKAAANKAKSSAATTPAVATPPSGPARKPGPAISGPGANSAPVLVKGHPAIAAKPSNQSPAKPRPAGLIRHRRMSVFSPKQFSAAVAAVVRKTKKSKIAAAVGGLASLVAASSRLNGPNVAAVSTAKSASAAKAIKCDVCSSNGTSANVATCDECKKNYHFECLEPPVKKTPKRRGYSWHCADCDPTDVEST